MVPLCHDTVFTQPQPRRTRKREKESNGEKQGELDWEQAWEQGENRCDNRRAQAQAACKYENVARNSIEHKGRVGNQLKVVEGVVVVVVVEEEAATD
jgi:hypothetical protein